MAEGLLRARAGDRFEVCSAGMSPKDLHPLAVRAMNEISIDISAQRAKDVREYLGHKHFAYLITVCDNADRNCPTTFPGVTHRMHWPFEDPAAFEGDEPARLAKFREVRDLIDARIQKWLAE